MNELNIYPSEVIIHENDKDWTLQHALYWHKLKPREKHAIKLIRDGGIDARKHKRTSAFDNAVDYNVETKNLQMDMESTYMITHNDAAKSMTTKMLDLIQNAVIGPGGNDFDFKTLKFTDGTSCIGGNVITMMQMGFTNINAVENNPRRCQMLYHNMSQYKYHQDKQTQMFHKTNHKVFQDNITDMNIPELQSDILFLDPPWGSTFKTTRKNNQLLNLKLSSKSCDEKHQTKLNMQSKLKDNDPRKNQILPMDCISTDCQTCIPLDQVVKQAIGLVHFIVLKLPPNFDIKSFTTSIMNNNGLYTFNYKTSDTSIQTIKKQVSLLRDNQNEFFIPIKGRNSTQDYVDVFSLLIVFCKTISNEKT